MLGSMGMLFPTKETHRFGASLTAGRFAHNFENVPAPVVETS